MTCGVLADQRSCGKSNPEKEHLECGEWLNLFQPFKYGVAILGGWVVREGHTERGV